jgi:hypothetical protein
MDSGTDHLTVGFPHSEILGSKFARNSPRLFAACHVLHRLSVPRHPPDALRRLISAVSLIRSRVTPARRSQPPPRKRSHACGSSYPTACFPTEVPTTGSLTGPRGPGIPDGPWPPRPISEDQGFACRHGPPPVARPSVTFLFTMSNTRRGPKAAKTVRVNREPPCSLSSPGS